jgi:beta-carotene ketolase (CrtW type)
MNPQRQTRIGIGLAGLILSAWTAVHVYGVFMMEVRPSLWLAMLIGFQTWLSVGLYIVAHDAMHGSLWPTNHKAGNAIGTLALWLYAGFSFRKIVLKHQAHHRHSGSQDDPDFAAATPSRLMAWYGLFMRTYFGWLEATRMAMRVGIYFLLGAQLENILLLFAIPALLSSFQLFYFGTFLPHRHKGDNDATDFQDHHRARSNRFGYFVSLLTCFHFGYHYEHHARPAVPWWQLPREKIT